MESAELESYSLEVSQDSSQPEWLRKAHAFIAHFLDAEAGPILQESSGSTGSPKRFELSREAMLLSARKTLDFFEIIPGERVLTCLPVDYIAGKMMIVRALLGELDLCLAEPSSRPLESAEGNFRFASMVPMQVARSLEAGDELGRIASLLIGGGEIHPALRKDLEELKAMKVYESFAMTETVSHFALRRINGPGAQKSFRALEGVQLGVDDRGCLQVAVPGITPGQVQSNDLVELGEASLEFRWLGRADNLIKSGGINIIPEVLEEKISEILGMPCLLLPQADVLLGQKLVLLVEAPHGRGFDSGEVMNRLRGELNPLEQPRRIVTVSELPRLASFKPDRQAARSLL